MAIARRILEAGGFAPGAVRFQVAAEPPAREFVVQYDETDLEFLERQFAYHGLVYAFDPAGEQATLIVTDDSAGLADILGTVALDYQVTRWLIVGLEMSGDQASGPAYAGDSDGPTFTGRHRQTMRSPHFECLTPPASTWLY